MEYVNDEEPQQQLTPEEFLALRKSEMRRRSWWAIGLGTAAVLFNVAVILFFINSPEYAQELGISRRDFFSLLFRSVFFLLGLFFIGAGIWGLYEARRMTVEDLIPSPEAIEFLRQAAEVQPVYSYIILGCLIAVFLAQMAGGSDADGNYRAIDIAGLVKPDTWTKGEYWRVLTSGVLHGGFLHIYFNSQAFYGFASLIEFVSNRARMAIVFLLAIVGGGIFSLIFLPEGRSVGASGGIMGLIGYLAVYGYRRKRQLPPDFLRSMLVNIGFVAAFGLVAYQIIDNFAHLGGLFVGVIYGFLTIPRDLKKNPRAVGVITEAAGMISTGVIVFISILTILLITEYIKF
jgi:membrane associated rhomboid family serine protease